MHGRRSLTPGVHRLCQSGWRSYRIIPTCPTRTNSRLRCIFSRSQCSKGHTRSTPAAVPFLKTCQRMATAAATLRVLVVDDEPLIRWCVAETLNQAGHTVMEAPDAAATLQLLGHRPAPDVVLLDFRLPDSQDLRLLADVRRLAPSAA